MMEPKKVLIVGGEGAMGSWFKNFFEQRNWPVGVHDPDAPSNENIPLSEINEYDVVMVAVPIDSAPDVIRDVAARMQEGLLMDVTGVKVEPVKAMQVSANDEIELLGTHPMYGPSVESMNGQTVIMVKSRDGYLTRCIESLFDEAGANIKITSAEKHDEMMSVVQGLTHFTYISVGKTLDSLDFDVAESREFISPVYSIMLDFVGRILAADPHLYADMQRNQPVEDKHELMVESATRLKELIEDGDHDGFVEEMREAGQHYDDQYGARSRTDKLIQAHVREYQSLLAKVGEKIALVNVGSEKQEKPIHYGIVRDIEGQTLYLEEGRELLELDIGNIVFLEDYLENNPDVKWSSVTEWRAERLGTRLDHVSVQIQDAADETTLQGIAEDAHNDIVAVNFVEEWRGEQIPNSNVSYTFEIETIEDEQSKEAIETVQELFEGVGGSIR